MLSAAWAMACRPLEQKRFTVSAGTLFGHFAKNTAFLATFRPCSASGMAQPKSTSSMSSAFRPGTRASAPFMAAAAKSSGRVLRRVPLSARPTGVRTADAMITLRGNAIVIASEGSSKIVDGSSTASRSIAEGLVVHEHELHALLTLLLATEGEERFTLQIQKVLFGEQGASSDFATTQDVGDLVRDQGVVRRGEAPFHQRPNPSADRLFGVVASRW